MSLIDQARQDVAQITSDLNGFAVSATFTAPDDTSKTINVIHSKHHMAVDTEGARVNAKNASICFAESLLTDYPVRNAAGEVSMRTHRVAVADSTGVTKLYSISEHFPDETLGLIVCILTDYE